MLTLKTSSLHFCLTSGPESMFEVTLMSTLHQNPGPRMDAPPPGCGQPSLFGRWQRKGGEQSGKSQGPDRSGCLPRQKTESLLCQIRFNAKCSQNIFIFAPLLDLMYCKILQLNRWRHDSSPSSFRFKSYLLTTYHKGRH